MVARRGRGRQRSETEARSLLLAGPARTSQVCSTIAPSVPVTPAQGATSNDLQYPIFIWDAVSGVSQYAFELAYDDTFLQPIDAGTGYNLAGGTQAWYTSGLILDPNTTYYWRVASMCGDGTIGAYSQAWSFTTGSGSVSQTCSLQPPALQQPASGATLTTLSPDLTFQLASTTSQYELEVASDSSFDDLAWDWLIYGFDPVGDAGQSYAFSGWDNLQPGTQYYWRVASVCADIDTDGDFSAPATFTTPSGGTFLAAPGLIAPPNGANTASIGVSLVYSDVVGADDYQVRLYDSPGDVGTDNWEQAYRSTDTAVSVIEEPQTLFYWRAKDLNGAGWSPLSSTWTFTTPVTSAVATITPAGGILDTSPSCLALTFPAGAVSTQVTVTYDMLGSPLEAYPNFLFANCSFTLVAYAGSQQVTQFNEPYTMVLTYDPSDLLAAGISAPQELNVAYWDGSEWQNILPCAGCSINTTSHTVTVVLNHMTEFALGSPVPIYLPMLRR
jgi:hypothetical protein